MSFSRYLGRHPFNVGCITILGLSNIMGMDGWPWRLLNIVTLISVAYQLGHGRTPATVKVLGAMALLNRPVTGVDVARLAGIGPGDLYPTLRSLENQAVVTSRWEHVGASYAPRRRLYQLNTKADR